MSLVAAPERIIVSTCVGCGAMSRLGTCEDGCSEQRLDLVRGAAYDELLDVGRGARACVGAFRPVLDQLAQRQPAPDQYEHSYRSLQDQAREVLHRFPDVRREQEVLIGPAEPAITSWCADCGAVDAPAPCLEVCVRVPVEWVSADSYAHERERVLSDIAAEVSLRALLRRLVSVTPLEGQWRRCWQVLQAQARNTLHGFGDAASIAS